MFSEKRYFPLVLGLNNGLKRRLNLQLYTVELHETFDIYVLPTKLKTSVYIYY
jgi:hypothetical protein